MNHMIWEWTRESEALICFCYYDSNGDCLTWRDLYAKFDQLFNMRMNYECGHVYCPIKWPLFKIQYSWQLFYVEASQPKLKGYGSTLTKLQIYEL